MNATDNDQRRGHHRWPRSIVINGDQVIIDGEKMVDKFPGAMELRIIEGTVENLKTDRSVTCGVINGNVEAGGSVNSDAIGGHVRAGGSVNCDDVGGSVTAGGSVNAGDITGDVRATVVKHG